MVRLSAIKEVRRSFPFNVSTFIANLFSRVLTSIPNVYSFSMLLSFLLWNFLFEKIVTLFKIFFPIYYRCTGEFEVFRV